MVTNDENNDNDNNEDHDDNDGNNDIDNTHMVIEWGQECEGRCKRQNKQKELVPNPIPHLSSYLQSICINLSKNSMGKFEEETL